jgi:hypothetical protein
MEVNSGLLAVTPIQGLLSFSRVRYQRDSGKDESIQGETAFISQYISSAKVEYWFSHHNTTLW